MSADVARILRDAADLIEPPGCWTTGAGAKDKDGSKVQSEHTEAVCWCAGGAIVRSGGTGPRWGSTMAAIRYFVGFLAVPALGPWNDRQPGPEPVIAALRAAADEAEQRQ